MVQKVFQAAGETEKAEMNSPEISSVKIFVSSLPFQSSEKSLCDIFSPFGKVENVELHADWETPTYEPYAYVTFSCDNMSDKVSRVVDELDGKKIGSTHIRVHKAVNINCEERN
ncbi:MAG: RNA-binding protein [Nitrospina sp.]|jgi:RNA recognition motif-containing protein|nr:RNA-binding protein [Nitrospina sp.]